MNTNVVHIHTQITVPSEALFADAIFMNLLEAERQANKQLKAQELALKLIRDQIKDRMGEHTRVIGLSGEIAATYNWVKVPDRIDMDLFRDNFPIEYALCLKEKKEELTRRLEVK